MRRVAVIVAAALAAIVAGAGMAIAAFTAHLTTPQEITAADSFGTPPTVSLTVRSRTNDGGASGDHVQFGLQIENTGDARIDLPTLEVRYWFTTDGSSSEPIAECIDASVGCKKLTVDAVSLDGQQDRADHYIRVTFPKGQINPGKSVSLDQLAFRDPAGATYSQDNDYSFLDQSTFTDNPAVTVLLDGQLVWGTQPAPVAHNESVKVQYANRDSAPADAAIMFTLQVLDTGTTKIDLRRLTLRYWFTRDGGTAPLTGSCGNAQIGCGKIAMQFRSVSPPREGTDSYLEVGFSSGTLGLGSSTGAIELNVHKSDYAAFDETDDYSRATDTSFETTARVTAYLDGRLAWGTEP